MLGHRSARSDQRPPSVGGRGGDAGRGAPRPAPRSFEPPTHDDLLATVYGTPNASPGACVNPNATPACSIKGVAFATPDLKAQAATTVEGGWRGRAARYRLYAEHRRAVQD